MSKAGANYLRGAGWGETLLQMLPHGAVDLTAWMDEKTKDVESFQYGFIPFCIIAGIVNLLSKPVWLYIRARH